MTVNLPAPPYSYETGKTSASTNWKPGAGNGRVVKGITIHHWGSSMSLGFDGIVSFLCSARPANPTSAHYVAQGKDEHGVKKPRVACIVDPDDIAYHAGNWNGNLTTIGIECRPNGFPEDLEVVAQLIARLRNQYGPLPLYPHSHWTSTECPGDNYRAQLAWLDKRANAILAAAAAPPAPAPAPKPAAVATSVSLGSQPDAVGSQQELTLTAKVTPAAAVGSVVFEWLNGTTWTSFGNVTPSTGVARVTNRPWSTVKYRARFVPKDAAAFKPSTSAVVEVTVVDLAKLAADVEALKAAAKPSTP